MAAGFHDRPVGERGRDRTDEGERRRAADPDGPLKARRSSVAQVAERLGYQTETAFRRAFKRVRGVGPGDVRRRARLASATP
jgi:AraC-like DNA-binding protein